MCFLSALGMLLLGLRLAVVGAELVAPLPDGVRAVWDLDKAHREATPTRERICLNGLWRWQPSEAQSAQVPAGGWGYFKVPGSWPGITDYMQKDSQSVFPHPDWKDRKLGGINAAWYQREFTVPDNWTGRRILFSAEYLNSYARVFVDGRSAGELRFPAGQLDLTMACKPGTTHVLSVLVVALPLKGILLSYTDSASAREVKGAVPRRGFCGDVHLIGEPTGPRIVAVKVETSVRRQEFTWGATFEDLVPDARYILHARVMDLSRSAGLRPGTGPVERVATGRAAIQEGPDLSIREFNSQTFQAGDTRQNRIEFAANWVPDKFWDIHTPQNVYGMELSLLDAGGKPLDVQWTTRFGFREFWIEGRDFQLNGTRLHLSAVPLDNAQIGAALSTYAAARESLERLKTIGINFVYTHNYSCEPGAHLGFSEILKAADDVGMLVALTQPHFSHYDWKAPDADGSNGYALHAAFYARVAQEHPSVVMYAMSHNATGYEEDMNPDLIDGVHDPRDTWSARNAKIALRAEAIVHGLDPARIIYHHASGNLGSMHAINFYPNFVPIQELSDWFGHWAAEGVKPVFLCEYGAPFTWDWTMYRGWYQGQREFGSAKVPWEFCLAEWNAQFFGDRAYAVSEPEKANLRWEARQFRATNLWHRWDYPNEVGSSRFEERYPVLAMYLHDNWRAFRGWGVSAISPWEYGHYWKLRDGVDKRRQEYKVDWDHLQRPGFSPDYSDQRYERMDLAFRKEDWIATPAAEALLQNNQPLLACFAGKTDVFTGKDHNFEPGETVGKQILVINDSRASITCDCEWSLALPQPLSDKERTTVAAGQQVRIPLRLELPSTLAPGRYELSGRFQFSDGVTQRDRFLIDVQPRPQPWKLDRKIALFDPKGETRALLEKIGIKSNPVSVGTDLSPYHILILGKEALGSGQPAPNISKVREGLRVIVFEQTAEVLEKRFGFRVEEYGLRQLFPRVPDHPALAGLETGNLRDWRGEATILSPRLNYTLRPRYGPTVQWCGMPVTRLWRCGNRGNVASVLIEKPAVGDFLSLLEGGFGLQYSALLMHPEGQGLMVFCQTDVTGRTQSDPAAETLVRNLLAYVAIWKPGPHRTVAYAGEPAGKQYLEHCGLLVRAYEGGKLSTNEVLVLGPGGGRLPAGAKTNIADWLKEGGNMLAIGMSQADADAALPFPVRLKRGEHIAAFFDAPGMNSLLSGIGPATVHNRDPREFPLVTDGARLIADGVLAQAQNANVVFCQLAPWQFEGRQPNLRRTRRTAATLVSRLLANMGVASSSPIVVRFQPEWAPKGVPDRLAGLYLELPEEWDDPYRFFRW